MKISIVLNSGVRVAAKRPDGADFVLILKCPNPKCNAAPCRVRGDGVRHHDHDTYYVRAIALCCTDQTQIVDIGGMRVKMDTLFGIVEDEAVLTYGRPRVYDGVR